MIAVMGPEAAVNAVYYNRLQALPEAERAAEEAALRAEYREDVDIERLASELVDRRDRARRRGCARRSRRGCAPRRDRRDPLPAKRRSVTPV